MPYPAIFGIVGPTKFKRIQDGSELELINNMTLEEQLS